MIRIRVAVISALWPALVALALALAACQGPAAPPPAAPGPTLASQAAEALDKGDHARAADLYRRALASAPDSLPLHYGLAIAASYLNLKDEAIQEFRWVLGHAAKGSPDAEAARKWLVSAGALSAAESPGPTSDEARPAPGTASLEGQVVLPDGGQAQRRMVILYGLANTPTKEERYQARTDDNGRFRFPSVAPGPYMITDAVGGKGNWRLRVEIQPGQAASFDLTPANLIKVKDDFPNRG